MAAKCLSPVAAKQTQIITSPPLCLTDGIYAEKLFLLHVLLFKCGQTSVLCSVIVFCGPVVHSDAALQTQVVLTDCFWTEEAFVLMNSLLIFFWYLAEILELAGNAARDNKKGRVTPRHILLAIANDEELNQVSHSANDSQPFSDAKKKVWLMNWHETLNLAFCFPVSAAQRCDHRSGWSFAQHPSRAVGQEEGSKGQTGNSHLACSWEETQDSEESTC